MSACISRHGEYSEHTLDAEWTCTLCGDVDTAGLRAEVDRLRAERDEQKARAEEAEAERDEFNGFWKDALADVRKARDERDGAVKRYGALWADVKNAPFDTIFTKKLQGGILARADERGASRNEHRRSPLPHQPPRTTPRSAT